MKQPPDPLVDQTLIASVMHKHVSGRFVEPSSSR